MVSRQEDRANVGWSTAEMSRPTPIIEEDSMRTTFNTAAVALVVRSRRQLSHYFLVYTIVE